MSETTYRLSLGIAIFAVLTFGQPLYIMILVGILTLEGLTNFRVNYFVNSAIQFRKPKFINLETASIKNFDTDRALRLSVAFFVGISSLAFPEYIWFFSWFMSIMLLISGITDICPMTKILALTGLRHRPSEISHPQKKEHWHWRSSIAVKITSVVLGLVVVVSFSVVIWRLPYIKMAINAKYDNEISNLKLGIENHYYKHHSFDQLTKDNLKFFNTFPLSHLKVTPAKSDQMIFSLGEESEFNSEDAREILELGRRKYILEVTLDSRRAAFLKERNKILLTLALTLAVFSYFLIFTIKFIVSRPFDRMISFVQRVSDGDFSARLEYETKDEFNYLSIFFNEMLDKLFFQNQMLVKEIEDHKKSEYLLKLAKEEAVKANDAKTRFLANMSHEFRTPLNSVLGFSQVLARDSRLSKGQRHHVETIRKSGNHLLQLINDTLDLSKIEAGKMSLQENSFELTVLLRDIREMFKVTSREKGLEFKVMIQGFEAGEFFVSDDRKLRQVLINLVGNAIKFSSQGVIRLRVRRNPEDRFLFEIIDQGPGIEEENLKNLFQPFLQGRSGELEGGTGLGLSICKKYVDLLGGELKVKSIVNKGSKFYFSIPLPIDQAKVTENPTKATDSPVAIDINIKDLKIDPKILSQIKKAADVHNITELKQLNQQLSQMGPDEQKLSLMITQALIHYDIGSIQKLFAGETDAA